jgi:hypothetical protein
MSGKRRVDRNSTGLYFDGCAASHADALGMEATMKGLVWALYVMMQDPGAAAAPSDQMQGDKSLAFTGVTYLNKASCANDAATFTKMPARDKLAGADPSMNVTYVCVIQPKPGHYRE